MKKNDRLHIKEYFWIETKVAAGDRLPASSNSPMRSTITSFCIVLDFKNIQYNTYTNTNQHNIFIFVLPWLN